MVALTEERYQKEERLQKYHRIMNTVLTIAVLFVGAAFVQSKVVPIYEQISGITEERSIKSEISQIVQDESFRRCVYKDSRGLPTVGFGHLMTPADKFTCIDPHYAVKLLRDDYRHAQGDVSARYPWAEGEVKLLLINMTFNVGSTRLAKFKKTLGHLEREDFDLAAGEVLDSLYAKQVPNRAVRIAGRIMGLGQ